MPENKEFVARLNSALSATIADWYNNLSKDELLTYLHDMPNVDADAIRKLLEQSDINLAMDVVFATAKTSAVSELFGGHA